MALLFLPPGMAWGHGAFDERIEVANRSVAAAPSEAQPLLIRAELHRRHRDFAAALRDLDAASQLAPELHTIDYFRGLAHLDAGRSAQAEAALAQFLVREPNHPAARATRARALIALDRPLDAARDFDVAIAQQPVPIPDYYA